MIIWIGKEHFIRASEVSFDLVRRRVAKESGKVYDESLFYYPNLESSLKGALNKLLLDSDEETTIREALAELKQIEIEVVTKVQTEIASQGSK